MRFYRTQYPWNYLRVHIYVSGKGGKREQAEKSKVKRFCEGWVRLRRLKNGDMENSQTQGLRLVRRVSAKEWQLKKKDDKMSYVWERWKDEMMNR